MSASTMVTGGVSSGTRARFLGRILLADAATCVLMGLLLVVAAGLLGNLFALPSSLLFYSGWLLFPCAALMLFASKQSASSSAWVWLVIVGNLAWVVASLLVVTAWFSPNGLGMAFVLFQALVVAVLAGLEYYGLRNS
jgi:hypothetical protein